MSEQNRKNFYANGFQVFSSNKNGEVAITFLHEMPSIDAEKKATTIAVTEQAQVVMTKASATVLYKLMEKHLQNNAPPAGLKETEYPV